uniref:Chloride channel protein n=1 Tax=Trichuris muris TaxID=70415 RepID=A0A5S6QFY8_TRIMR
MINDEKIHANNEGGNDATCEDEFLGSKGIQRPEGTKAGICKFLLRTLQGVWAQLIMVGVLMGMLSFTIDLCAEKLRNVHFWLYTKAADVHPSAQPIIWVLYTLILILVSTAVCIYMSPQAAGSGIPVVKAIMGGVNLKEYLSFQVLICKTIVLILTLGSGLPLGKEDPFVHIAVMLATLLHKVGKLSPHARANEMNNKMSNEILAAASAVGIACTLGSPVGGVLFSIEITSVCFPLQAYWGGFVASAASTVIFRFLAYLLHENSSLVELSRTYFPKGYPFDTKELIAFAALGIFCGTLSIAFISFHRAVMKRVIQGGKLQKLLNERPLYYSAVCVVLIMALMCPMGYGHYFAGGLIPSEVVPELLSNVSWNVKNSSSIDSRLIEHWSIDTTSVFLVLPLYALNLFWIIAVVLTLPIPCGVYMPVFVIGAAFGRLVGEVMAALFPQGLRSGDEISPIIPGAYAVIGAAAFAGAVTHAISVSVITMEATGEVQYILPMLLAVLIAVSISETVQASLYDSLIELSGLPYFKVKKRVPRQIQNMKVGQVMVKDVQFLSMESTCREVQDLLIAMPKVTAFPLVKDPAKMILIGSIKRLQLELLLENHVGPTARKREAVARLKEKLQAEAQQSPKEQCSGGPAVAANDNMDLDETGGDLSPYPSSENLEFLNLDYIDTYTASRVQMTTRSLFKCLTSQTQSLADKLAKETAIDLFGKERRQWESEKLEEIVEFSSEIIDPAPFQLVENTGVMLASILFNQLGIRSAYVTRLGRLIGVVGLREIRHGLETARKYGNLPAMNEPDVQGPSKSTVTWTFRKTLEA